LCETPFNEDLLANVPEGVGDGAGGDVAAEHVAHVLSEINETKFKQWHVEIVEDTWDVPLL
jgi:hypothetical protein